MKVPGIRKWKREALERQVWRGGRGAIRRIRIRDRVIKNRVNNSRAYGRNRSHRSPKWRNSQHAYVEVHFIQTAFIY